jgi:tRNA G10  N-methylase Trm11
LELFQGILEPLFQHPQHHEIKSVKELRSPTEVMRRLRRIDWRFTNDDTLYLAHDVHPYPAKFIPQIPGNLIANLSLRGELVFDPFGGSGTTALEAALLGRRALCVDANPLGTLIAQVKTARPTPEVLADLQAIYASLSARVDVLADASELLTEGADYIPAIPNMERWFPPASCGELALIRRGIQRMDSRVARDIALLALSRVVLKVSFQDSETRYASKKREIASGETTRRFLRELDSVVNRVLETAPEIQYGVVQFATADSRFLDPVRFPDSSVDLVVGSPPYGNANDYHLYHRFRLFWLGFDPRELARIEIGSHLRHQKEGSGFQSYLDDMKSCLRAIERLLKPGRYAALVVGDSIYNGAYCRGDKALSRLAADVGLENVGRIRRPIHRTKRSFVAAGRRAMSEVILILRKPPKKSCFSLCPPKYRMWAFEEMLRFREASELLGVIDLSPRGQWKLRCDPYAVPAMRRLTFQSRIMYGTGYEEKTWQAILENGLGHQESSRKDPKYVTHGLHPYKGKFYPQLAKALLNIAGIPDGAIVLDPFCGSGTTLVEARLNGMRAYGCDLHPLAAKIARAKVGVLDTDPRIVMKAVAALNSKLTSPPAIFAASVEHLPAVALEEIVRWFARPVIHKLDWVLHVIRSVSSGVLQDYFEILLSSIVREISHQDPSDLRVRRRKVALDDADVVSLFRDRLTIQTARLQQFWSVRGYCPYLVYPALVKDGDSRDPTVFDSMGLAPGTVDAILTSPPYATALPYIDTDRLSLLIFFGMTSTQRRPIEERLTGSREISLRERRAWEARLGKQDHEVLPSTVLDYIRTLQADNSRGDAGFRRRNLPALLLRFFSDMEKVLSNCTTLLKRGGQALVVIGDNETTVNAKVRRIPTTDFVLLLAEQVGLTCVERIPISVTRENYRHMRNSITKNTVLRLRR